jgi:hypothetical protein
MKQGRSKRLAALFTLFETAMKGHPARVVMLLLFRAHWRRQPRAQYRREVPFTDDLTGTVERFAADPIVADSLERLPKNAASLSAQFGRCIATAVDEPASNCWYALMMTLLGRRDAVGFSRDVSLADFVDRFSSPNAQETKAFLKAAWSKPLAGLWLLIVAVKEFGGLRSQEEPPLRTMATIREIVASIDFDYNLDDLTTRLRASLGALKAAAADKDWLKGVPRPPRFFDSAFLGVEEQAGDEWLTLGPTLNAESANWFPTQYDLASLDNFLQARVDDRNADYHIGHQQPGAPSSSPKRSFSALWPEVTRPDPEPHWEVPNWWSGGQ